MKAHAIVLLCPKCNSKNIESDIADIKLDDYYIIRCFICNDCLTEFKSKYTCTEIKYICTEINVIYND